MQYSDFDTRLLQTFSTRYIIISVIMVIIAATLVVEIVHFFRTKSNQGISVWNLLSPKPFLKQRLSLKQQILRDCIAIIILFVYAGYSVIPVYNDISQQQYVKVEAQYSRNERDAQGNLFSNGHIYVEVNRETVRLELPSGWTEYEFPEGTFMGTVWYSKESKVVLSVELNI